MTTDIPEQNSYSRQQLEADMVQLIESHGLTVSLLHKIGKIPEQKKREEYVSIIFNQTPYQDWPDELKSFATEPVRTHRRNLLKSFGRHMALGTAISVGSPVVSHMVSHKLGQLALYADFSEQLAELKSKIPPLPQNQAALTHLDELQQNCDNHVALGQQMSSFLSASLIPLAGVAMVGGALIHRAVQDDYNAGGYTDERTAAEIFQMLGATERAIRAAREIANAKTAPF